MTRRRRKADNLILRNATEADIEDIIQLENACFSSPWPASAFIEELEKNWSTVLLAERENRIVGFMIYWDVEPEKHLLNFATSPRERRKGIGKTMMTHLLRESREDQYTQIVLEVRMSNRAARALYEGCGFAPVAIRPKYYADNGEDALLMILDLTADATPAEDLATARK